MLREPYRSPLARRIVWRPATGMIRSVPKLFVLRPAQRDGSPLANGNALDPGNSEPHLVATSPTFARVKRCYPRTSTFFRPRQPLHRCPPRNPRNHDGHRLTVTAHLPSESTVNPARRHVYP